MYLLSNVPECHSSPEVTEVRMRPDLPVLDYWQYRLSSQPVPGALPLDGQWLEVGPDLPLIPVTDAMGRDLGVILGFPIDLAARRIVEGAWRAGVTFDATAPGRAAEVVLRALAGPFLFILAAGGTLRLYPNAAGDVPCVRDDETGLTGSTAGAVLNPADYAARFNRRLYDTLSVDNTGWLPAGLTAHRGIRRLLCGHYLDLRDGAMPRFWLRDPVAPCTDTDALVDEMINLVQAQIEALVAGPKRVALALTAGRDSRMLLACARPWIDRMDIITVVGKERHMVDSEIAGRIARDLGLNYRTFSRLHAAAQERDLFILRGGHCIADANSHFHPSVRSLAENHVFIGGAGSELGRAFFWRPSDQPDMQITAARLTRRFGLGHAPELEGALDRWLDELAPGDAFHILDLAYHENHACPLFAAQFCCDPTHVRYAPLMTMRGVELMMSLPPEWKRSSRLGAAMIEKAWPELARYPYNTLGPLRDGFIKLQRALNNPRLVLTKLRRLRG